MNGLCYPDTDEGFLHTLASTAARTSPAQPIWESNIDTHFLTSGWRARGSGGLSNESLLRLCCDLWLVSTSCGLRRCALFRLQTPLPGGGVSTAGLKATTWVTQGRLIVHLAGSMFLLGWNVPRLPTFLLSPFACWLQLTPVPEWSLTVDITINTGHGDTWPHVAAWALLVICNLFSMQNCRK